MSNTLPLRALRLLVPLLCFLLTVGILSAQVQAQKPQDFYNLASQQFTKDDFAGAKASFTRAIELDSLYAEAYRGLGMADLELKDYEGAYRAWLKAVDLNPQDEKSRYFLGRLFYEADIPNQAAAWLREALKLRPDDYQAMTYLGLSAEALGYDQTALPLYRKALAASKSQGHPYSWAFLSLANFLNKQGDEKEALSVLEEGSQKCPEAHELAALGELLAAHNDPQRAEQVLRQAITLDPRLSQPHYRLGLLLKSLGRLDESRAEMVKFQEAKRQEDQVPKITVIRKQVFTSP
ncbi:MAG TPA: tetratricopeptide repeat protein [Bryobacteraceae bacterium]|nr:tetratricopeptide repeat protein [Bryobacteraceae bacterium]